MSTESISATRTLPAPARAVFAALAPDCVEAGTSALRFAGWWWRYDLEAVAERRSAVTLTFDWSPVGPAAPHTARTCRDVPLDGSAADLDLDPAVARGPIRHDAGHVVRRVDPHRLLAPRRATRSGPAPVWGDADGAEHRDEPRPTVQPSRVLDARLHAPRLVAQHGGVTAAAAGSTLPPRAARRVVDEHPRTVVRLVEDDPAERIVLLLAERADLTADFVPDVAHEAVECDTGVELVRAGLGVALVPRLANLPGVVRSGARAQARVATALAAMAGPGPR